MKALVITLMKVGRGGVEPPTFRFSGGRSYQLSYLPRRGPGESTGAAPHPAGRGQRDSRRMPADTSDLRDAARLGGHALAGGAGAIRDTHLAIARRAFTLTGPPARPVQLVHDTISTGVYGAVRVAMSAAANVGGAAVAARRSTLPSYMPII